MKFTPETLKEISEEYRISEENQERLAQEFFAEYPDIELTEEKYSYKTGKGVNYSAENKQVVLKFEVPAHTKVDNGSVRTAGAVYFHGKTFTHILLKSGYEIFLPHKVSDNKKKWYVSVKNLFFRSRQKV